MRLFRKKEERGLTKISWLESYHTFSFGEYYDPEIMGFSDLRVINDDVVAPGGGFATHAHNNMEIVSVVLSGALEHKDSLGNGSIIRPGEIQRMSAGTGILHSEFNPSETEPVHFLQIWILTGKQGVTPEYEQKSFSPEKMKNTPTLIVSEDGRDGSLKVYQDVLIFQTLLEKGKEVPFKLQKNRNYWIQIAQGAVELEGNKLEAGDGMAIASEDGTLEFKGIDDQSNFLIFDLRN